MTTRDKYYVLAMLVFPCMILPGSLVMGIALFQGWAVVAVQMSLLMTLFWIVMTNLFRVQDRAAIEEIFRGTRK